MNTTFPFAVMTLLVAGGCQRHSSAIPQIDYSTSSEYGVIAFKDDAPANARVNHADFPTSFVDTRGDLVDLTQFRGKSKVVLVVLRGLPQSPGGVFCPSCLAQTGSLMAHREEFTRRNAAVLVVFPGPAGRVGEFLQTARVQTPGEPAVLRVCLDEECAACTRLGIRADLAKPSTYILDTSGNLVYAYVGETSTDRPSVKAILAQVDRAP